MIVVLSGLVAILCGSHCCLLRKMSLVIVFSVFVPVTGRCHGTKGLGLTLLVDAMVQRDSVLRYWLMPWYKGTLCYCTVTAGTVGCSTKGLSLTVLLQLVQ